MNPQDNEFDEFDKLIALSLQKEGDMIPIQISEDELEIDSDEDSLPAILADDKRAVEMIFSEEEPSFSEEKESGSPVVPFPEEFSKAARHGEKLSEETLDKLRELLDE